MAYAISVSSMESVLERGKRGVLGLNICVIELHSDMAKADRTMQHYRPVYSSATLAEDIDERQCEYDIASHLDRGCHRGKPLVKIGVDIAVSTGTSIRW